MATKRSTDPADQALAKEFGNYISAVATIIVKPLQATTEAATEKIDLLVGDHLEQFGEQSNTLTNFLTSLKEEMKKSVEGIAAGHTQTRTALLTYAIQHSKDSRDEMKIQTDKLERSFLEAIEPKLQKFNDEVLSLFERSVIEHQKIVETSIAQLKVGLGLLALWMTAIGAALYFLK